LIEYTANPRSRSVSTTGPCGTSIVTTTSLAAPVIYFAGDLGQRIFQPPFSWLSQGVDVRGRNRDRALSPFLQPIHFALEVTMHVAIGNQSNGWRIGGIDGKSLLQIAKGSCKALLSEFIFALPCPRESS
jgi:hypothetical protein